MKKMINAINEFPYNQQQYGTFLVKNINKSKRKTWFRKIILQWKTYQTN